MFFGASPLYAFLHGGPITRRFLLNLPWKAWEHGHLDTRTHMLMPGWYPCIPGWHQDDVIRTERRGNQPDYHVQTIPAEHWLCVFNDDDSQNAMPQFLIGDVRVPDPESLDKVYKRLDAYINRHRDQIEADAIRRTGQSGYLYHMTSNTFHRGQPAQRNCWRWFGRVTINRCNINRTYKNEIRRQVNAYLPELNAGW